MRFLNEKTKSQFNWANKAIYRLRLHLSWKFLFILNKVKLKKSPPPRDGGLLNVIIIYLINTHYFGSN